MPPPVRHTVTTVAAILCFALPGACTAPLPSQAPLVLSLSARRIDTNAHADQAAIDRLVRSADLARHRVDEASGALARGDTPVAAGALAGASDALHISDAIRRRARNSRLSTDDTLASLALLHDVLARKAHDDGVLDALIDAVTPDADNEGDRP